MFDKKKLAQEIIDTWNSHDLDKFADYHCDGLEYTSPIIPKLTGKDIFILNDKAYIKSLWGKVLERIPDIKSEIIQICEGVDSVAVYYISSAKEKPIIDVMYFNEDGKVSKLHVFYCQ